MDALRADEQSKYVPVPTRGRRCNFLKPASKSKLRRQTAVPLRSLACSLVIRESCDAAKPAATPRRRKRRRQKIHWHSSRHTVSATTKVLQVRLTRRLSGSAADAGRADGADGPRQPAGANKPVGGGPSSPPLAAPSSAARGEGLRGGSPR